MVTTEKPVTKIEALKQFFGTDTKPITTKEMFDFRKNDPVGFDEIAELCLVAIAS
jgi:hypothetical protein